MSHYSLIAKLFQYPDEHISTSLKQLRDSLDENYKDCHEDLLAFEVFLGAYNVSQQQEYYIRTFDVNALCYLDIGYILFGEDYKRGEFLVNLSKEHKAAGNDCGSELADHLPNLLNLLSKAGDREMVEELAYCLMIPALKEMLLSFKNESNVYRNLLQIVITVLEQDFNGTDLEQFRITRETKDCFSGKAGKKGHSCGMNQRKGKGLITNPY